MKKYIPIKAKIEEFLNNKEYEKPTQLCSLMTALGSDKGSGHHNYTTLYSKLFESLKDQKVKFFELGIGWGLKEGSPGASLFGWSIYFPNGQVYGADINRGMLFNHSGIRTYYCDQLSPESIQEMFSHEDLKDIQFDIIIDDGRHHFDANLNFLVYSLHKLKEGGVYIIEDLFPEVLEVFNQVLPILKEHLGLHYIETVKIPIDKHKNKRDNNALLIIQK